MNETAVVQTSTDLQNWTSVQTFVLSVTPCTFFEVTPGSAHRFYRLQLVGN